MTEFSFPWGCSATGDGGPNSFSLEIVEKMNRYLNNANPDSEGVIYWTQAPYTGLLGATNPSGDIVRIASGLGLVEGWLYENDANVDFDVSGGNANATDLIVLRRSNPGALPQTVRLAHLRGPAAGTATVTQTASVWEIALWEVDLDGSGNFSALNDVREYVHTPLKVATINIDDEAVTPAKISNRTRRVSFNMGWTDIANASNVGMIFPDTAQFGVIMNLICPEDYLSGGFIYTYGWAVNSGNVYLQLSGFYAAAGQAYNSHTIGQTPTPTLISNTLTQLQFYNLSSLSKGDMISFAFYRDPTNPLDTLTGNMNFWGAFLEYTADS